MPFSPSYRPNDHPLLWDAAIVGLLLLSAWMGIAAHLSLPDAQGVGFRMVLQVLRVGGFAGFFLLAYGSYVEPRRLRVARRRIALPVSAPLRIAVLSDFHVGPYKGKAYVERACRKTLALQPDLIFLVGDFLYDATADIEDLRPLTALRAPLGVFAVEGNHDVGRYISWFGRPYVLDDRMPDVAVLLAAGNITLLRDAHRIVDLPDGGKIAVAGIKDLWTEKGGVAKALAGIPASVPTILLAHQPDVILDEECKKAELIVSGHNHGGQVRLPLLGPLGGVPSKTGRRYARGLHRLDNGTRLLVTQGCGESGPRARLFCAPEVVLLEIEPD